MCRFPAVLPKPVIMIAKTSGVMSPNAPPNWKVASSVAVHKKNKSCSTIITYVNNIYHVMSCHFTMVSVRWVRHGVIIRLGWTNIHDMLFSVPILTVTILTLNCKPNPDPINTKTNLNPNTNNPHHNHTPRMENSLEHQWRRQLVGTWARAPPPLAFERKFFSLGTLPNS